MTIFAKYSVETMMESTTHLHKENMMLEKIKEFFYRLWISIEQTQMARAEAMLKNSNWTRIE
jgi:hypothetical protein